MSSLEVLSRSVPNKSDTQDPKNVDDSRTIPQNSRISSIYERCHVCSKKVMSHSKCKCANFYCGKHLHQHDCTFSHFLNHKSVLEKNNIKIESDKIIRL